MYYVCFRCLPVVVSLIISDFTKCRLFLSGKQVELVQFLKFLELIFKKVVSLVRVANFLNTSIFIIHKHQGG